MATAIPSIACLGVIGRNNNPLHISIFPSHDPHTNTLQPVRTPLQFSLLLASTLDIFDLRAKHSSTNPPPAASSSSQGPSGAGAGAAGAPLSGEYGLLHAVDERLAAYGFETNTGVKFIAVVDMRGRRIDGAALAMSSPALQQLDGFSGVVGSVGGHHAAAASGGGYGGGGGGGGYGGAGGAGSRAASVVGLRESDLKVVFKAMQSAYVRLLQNPFYDPDEHGGPAGAAGGKRIVSRRFDGEMKRVGEGWTVGVTSL